ncbi:GNAT family N-acetyltransferase [Streptomyces boncukensis]|uniref:GNAT family N-acetyltransferase n=1 Tax=Streptomyces boncukensis TaxID=2711219 RepID=A0A6G4X5I8_9ACTN|nr:GNAT family N-acetyltransferase [Streptomyces boncukensis]NGO71931.1 GNAT family N-acetyltransferase [Streptomyces boncukensis]
MTTTLRPSTPETRTPDGGYARAYDICVNSRPIGAVRLSTDERQGPGVGRLAGLVVHERERRRGRGTVAALAAEEVLRGWGCARVETSVPFPEPPDAGAQAAPGLLETLGYRERNRNMVKELREPPALPDGTAVRPMTEEEFPAWWEGGRELFVRSRAEYGDSPERCGQLYDEARRAQLPDGVATRGTALRVLTHRGAEVGTIWVSLSAPGHRADADAWVYDVEVRQDRRGEGHGRSLMLLAERECLAAARGRLGLNVYAYNTRARSLYESLGYREVERYYTKPLV